MRQNPERMAWTILVSAFLTFCALLIAIPLGIRGYLLNAEVEQTASLTAISGTVVVARPGQPGQDAVTATLESIPEGSSITTDESSEGAVSVLDPHTGQTLATLQVYGGSILRLRVMRSPRFVRYSPLKQHIAAELDTGRVRGRVSLDVSPSVVLEVQTPHGLAVFDQPGSYSIEVYKDETSVVVREGAARVSAQGKTVALDDSQNQRANIQSGQPPIDGLPAERNLIVDGDFAETLGSGWTIRTQKEVVEQTDPAILITTSGGQRAVEFDRPGAGMNWAYVGIRQEINRDARDMSSLRLHLAVQVVSQDLFNCGVNGTECPVMVKVIYEDKLGGSHEWLKGFYANRDPSGRTPVHCVVCPPPTSGVHVFLPSGTWVPYDSPNLIQLFKEAGIEAVSITAIEIYASGHSYQSLISEVELLAQE